MDVYDANGNLIRGYYLGVEHEYNNGNFLRGYYLGIEYEYQDLMHCNWGWDASGNGYFHTGVFAPQRPVYPDWDNAGDAHDPYIRDLKIIKNIRL